MKNKVVFECQNCGAKYSKWVGKCEACNSWNCVVQARDELSAIPTGLTAGVGGVKLSFSNLDGETSDYPRISCGIKELDRTLGGGLVAGGVIPSPVGIADVVTTTTHKTLRGPRGGMILTNNEEIAKKIDKAVFPGIQGGPLEHIIAGKAVALYEASQPEFKEYAAQIIKNAKALAQGLMDEGMDIVGGMTENHLMTLDLRKTGKTGKDMANVLEQVGITANKNTVPNDPQSPFVTSGIRLGVPAVTTRGFKEEDMTEVAKIIASAIFSSDNELGLQNLRERSLKLCKKYPIYK